MKSLRFLAVLAISAISFSCTQSLEIENAQSGSNSETKLVASLDQTRTVNNADNTMSWVIGDQMTVFYTKYCGYGSAVFTRIEGDIFMGCPIGARFDKNDWYAAYPCVNGSANPADVAFEVPAAQVQSGNDSQSHIAGANAPLYGSAKEVKVGIAPDLTMHHLASFVKINVTNDDKNPIVVKSIKLSAPCAVAGDVSADLSAEEIALTEVDTENTVELTVEDGSEIAVGESACFYISVLPICCDGEIAIEIAAESAEKEITSAKAIAGEYDFAAGTYNTVNFSFVNTGKKAYVEADSIEEGKSYIIVCDDKALANESGIAGAYSVADKVEGDKLYILENDAAAIEWVAQSAGSYSYYGEFTFANDGNVLARIGDGDDSIILSGEAGTRTAWSFDGDDLYQNSTNHFGVTLYLGYNGAAWNADAQSQTDAIKVYVAE